MRAHLIRGLHHARRGVFYTCVISLILMAVAVGIADRLLPLVAKHPDRIAAWLIARSGRPVHFDRSEAHWTRRGPVFALYNLRIGEGSQALAVDRAELLVAMYSGWMPDHPFTELRLRGLALTIERDAAGRWRLVGLSGPQEAENHNPLASLEGLGELDVSEARLTVRSPSDGFNFTSPRVALRMRVSDKRLRAGVRVEAASGAPLLATVDFDRLSNDGKLWIGSDDVDLSPWSGLLGAAGAQVRQGRGRVQAWSRLEDSRVVSVQVEAALHDIDVARRAVSPGSVSPHVALASLWVSARLRKLPGGWEFVAPRLRLRNRRGTDDVLDGLAMRQAWGFALAAPSVDAGIALSIAMLSDRVPPALRDWLVQASPQVRLSGVRVVLPANGRMRGQAHLDELGWQPVAERPAIHGVSGNLLFDRDAITLAFDPPDHRKHPSELLWPPAFGAPVALNIEGRLTFWRDDDEWVLESSGLHASNDAIDLLARLAMRFRSDGRKPRLDLFATLQPARMVDAKRYWLRHRMTPSSVTWLDNAIEGGKLAGAHVLIAGDLDYWPFRHGEGRFDAVADLADAQVHFDPAWPRAEHLDGQIVFNGPGMRIDGAATIVGIRVSQLQAEIPDFHEPVLDLRGDTLGSGAQILALLRQSPLQKKFGETLAALDIRGEGLHGTVHLAIPLKHELGEPKVEGELDLAHAGLSDKRWNLAFTDVDGRVHFDQSGVLADTLNVHWKGDPASLRLAIGDATGSPAIAVAATLTGTLPVANLIDQAPGLDWLKPLIAGRSAWTIEVKVPTAASGLGAAQLSVRSDLRGSTLKLPTPLDKAPGAALPLQVTTRLPASAGEIGVSLGDVLNLRGRYDDAQPFRGLIAFGAPATGPLPVRGLAIGGHVGNLDAAGWAGFASSGASGSGGLQSVDVQADSLLLGGRHFAATRVRMARQADTTSLRLDGDALAGSITLPSDLSRGIRGQFDRLYWPGSGPAATPGASLVADGDTDMDPAKVPPLRLDVADVRFGDARLGHLILQTHPIALGLHIDQLDATAKSQSVKATGDWTRAAANATRTQLAIVFTADSLGRMLDAFGFKGVVAAGKTNARLQANWAGSPVAFRLAALDGTLDLDVGQGRLLEVKPGAGRVLGLVSLAELPRRLSFDFRDFFDKGLSFNSMRGRFVFAGGVARTDNLAIKGPATDIRISGSADLVGQKYDQTIDVLPKAGGIVTAVGAAVAGPVGAAVGAVAGQVLSHPLQKIAHKRYRVTGPWANPEVKQVPLGDEAPPPEPAAG